MRPYLNDFNKRMDSLVIPYKLAQYCINNVKAYRRGIISDELFYKLIHYVLLYIEDCNIRQKTCTKTHVSDELKLICNDMGIGINTYELASDIINHCCENDGNRLEFNAPEENLPPFEIRLIDSKRSFTNGKYETSYELTSQCLDYIYSSKEIAEIGRVSIEQIKLEKAIKAGNFASAKYIADSLVLTIQNQKKSFRSKEKIIISNIISLKVPDIMKDIDESLDMIHQQREESRNIKKLLETASGQSGIKIYGSDEAKAAFQDIQYVNRRLDYILGLQMDLISVVQDFSRKYKEQLTSAEFMTSQSSIDIMEDIIKPLEMDLKGIVNPLQILIPLFTLSAEPIFNLNTIFQEQTIIKEENMVYTEVETPDIDSAVNENEDEIAAFNEQYEKLFLIILNETVKNSTSTLSNIINKHSVFAKYLSAAKVVLAKLLYENEIVFDDESKFRGADDREGFYPETLHTKCLVSLEGTKLVIETDERDEVYLEDINEQLKIKSTITVPNMYFKIMNKEGSNG